MIIEKLQTKLVKPKSKQEMLKVSGVGEFKFEKYGERFLSCIEKFESNS